MNDDETEKIASVFENLGAQKPQAKIMAAQLLKRADQMAKERNIPRLEALNYLLQVTIAGRDGRVFEGESPGTAENKPNPPAE